MKKDVVKDRPGKQADGSSKSREYKLGCVFTQTTFDSKGHPIRDPGSTTYVGGILEARHFGPHLSGEALRRGQLHAKRSVVLGDGVAWIWNIADEHFPDAIQIVDLYHALEHVDPFLKALSVARGREITTAEKAMFKACLRHSAGMFLKAAERKISKLPLKKQVVIRKTLGYFLEHAKRMRYKAFQADGLFIGSGVIEGGCKNIVAQRFKKSGMQWTLEGASAIAAIKVIDASQDFDAIWLQVVERKTKRRRSTAA